MSEKVDINTLHNSLIDNLVERELIKTAEVEAAFRAIRRDFFLPDVEPERVYTDAAIPTRFDENEFPISSSSQPTIMAIMLEQLELQPGDNVLEVGAGTGYNAALMSQLVGEEGYITTMDIDEDIVSAAREHLEAAGCDNVTVVCGDGMAGFTGNAPYDAIILTVGGWEIAPAWLEQLKEDGRIVLPLSLNGPQFSIAFEREGAGLTSVSIVPCGFMRLRGPNGEARTTTSLNDEKTMHLTFEDYQERPRVIDPSQIKGWLEMPGMAIETGVQLLPRELWQSFQLWVAVNEPEQVSLIAREEAVEKIPLLMSYGGDRHWGMSVGLVGQGGMAFYIRPSDWPTEDLEDDEERPPFELGIRGYGDADELVERLRAVVLEWDGNGRVGTENMRVRVVPVGDISTLLNTSISTPLNTSAGEGQVFVRRRWHDFVVDWDDGAEE